MANFIKLQYTEFLEDYTDGALFLGGIATDQIFSTKNIEEIDGLLGDAGRGTVSDRLLPFLESVGYTFTDVAELYNTCLVGNDPDEFDTVEEFEEENEINLMDAINFDLPDFINNMFYYIECEQNKKGEELTEAFISYLGLEAYTVGYSPWSLVVTYKDSNQEFYNDLYNGWNFYDLIEVDENGELVDIIGGFYIRNDQELQQAVEENFGLDSFKLIDNDEADAFDLPKAETITTYE